MSIFCHLRIPAELHIWAWNKKGTVAICNSCGHCCRTPPPATVVGSKKDDVAMVLQAEPIYDVSASDLASCNSLSFLSFPVGPDCYMDGIILIQQLIDSVEEVDTKCVYEIVPKLPHLYAHTFKTPSSPETDFCRKNLVTFIDLIKDHIKSPINRNFSGRRAENVQGCFTFFLASSDSKPEYSLVFDNDSVTCGAIASAAKPVDSSAPAAIAQGFQLGSDFMMDMVAKGLTHSQAVVPVVLACADAIQIGVVRTLGENNFPCSFMLTEPLSLMNANSRDRLARWVVALAGHCERMNAVLSEQLNSRADPNLVKCRVNAQKLFFKPIFTDAVNNATFAVTSLLRAFQMLHKCEECRQYIVFPIGQIGMPDRTQRDFKKRLIDNLLERFKHDDCLELISTPGYPIIVYPKLDDTEWFNCAEHCDVLCSNERCSEFLHLVQRVFAAVERAGLIHLDARLANFMFRIVPDEANSGAAAAAGRKERLELKLVDWDSCSPVHYHLPGEVTRAFNKDQRYPRDAVVADASIHQFFYAVIEEKIKVTMWEPARKKSKTDA